MVALDRFAMSSSFRKSILFKYLNIRRSLNLGVVRFWFKEKGAFLNLSDDPLIANYHKLFFRIFYVCNRKYKLESIVRVEKKEEPEKGSRYFLELQVGELQTGSSHILAEYVYRPLEANPTLCYPKGMQWNRTADVYLIVTSKNLGRWVHHFIKNVEQIVRETKDPHLHVVIFDFESPDIDLKPGGDSHIKWTGMLVGNFEFNP